MFFAVLLSVIMISALPSASYILLPLFILMFFIKEGFKVDKIGGINYAVKSILLLTVISLIQGEGVLETFKLCVRYFSFALLMLVVNRLVYQIDIKRLIFVMAVLPWFFYPIDFFYLIEPLTGLKRFSYVFSHPNHFAYYLVPLGVFFILRNNEDVLDKWGLISVFLLLALSKSTGGMLVITFVLAYHYKNKIFVPKFVFLSLIAFIVIGYLGVGDKVIIQFSSFDIDFIRERLRSDNLGGAGSLTWRIIYWHLILEGLMDLSINNVIFGNGFSTMSHGNYKLDFMYTDPHNDFIRLFGECGVFGLFVLVILVMKVTSSLKHHKVIFLLALLLPMLIGNVIVNPSYLFMMLLTFTYNQKFYSFK